MIRKIIIAQHFNFCGGLYKPYTYIIRRIIWTPYKSLFIYFGVKATTEGQNLVLSTALVCTRHFLDDIGITRKRPYQIIKKTKT